MSSRFEDIQRISIDFPSVSKAYSKIVGTFSLHFRRFSEHFSEFSREKLNFLTISESLRMLLKFWNYFGILLQIFLILLHICRVSDKFYLPEALFIKKEVVYLHFSIRHVVSRLVAPSFSLANSLISVDVLSAARERYKNKSL